MKSAKTKGAYEAPRVTPGTMQLVTALLVSSNQMLYLDLDTLVNVNDTSEDEYFELGF